MADLLSDTLDQSSPAELDLTQDVQFVRTADGVNIAVATAGNGQTIVKTGNWLTHVEHDWESSIWASLNQELASRFRLVRFDGRGYGLSDWDVENISFEASMRDLETVIDGLSLDRVSLLGISQGAASALAYAARHPQWVAKIVIHGGYVRGRKRRNSAEQERAADMFVALMHGWGDEHSAFMRAFSSMFLPKGTAEQIGWFTDLQRKTASPANALRLRIANDQLEISDVVGAVRAPTLVIHSRYDAVVPIAQGRMIAQLVRGANFVELESDNHLILPEEPVWPRFISEIVGFFGRP